MFWCIILKPEKPNTQIIDRPLRITQAVLDTKCKDSKTCQVTITIGNRSILVCSLKKNGVTQTPLNLFFEADTIIVFMNNGNSNVHLSGHVDPYLMACNPTDVAENTENENNNEQEEVAEASGTRFMARKRKMNSKDVAQKRKRMLCRQRKIDNDSA